VIPCRVTIVSVHDFGGDASDLTCRSGRLNMTKVREESNSPGEAIRQTWGFGPLRVQFDHIENELSRRQQPAQRVGQWKSDSLSCFVIELCSVGVGGVLHVAQGPEPNFH